MPIGILLKMELAKLARTPHLRINIWSKEVPLDWNPTQITNPETDMPFTDSSAWIFIAELLESNHPFDLVELRRPPGEVAYETTAPLRPNLPKVYIKIQKRCGRIIGRSFHYSLRS